MNSSHEQKIDGACKKCGDNNTNNDSDSIRDLGGSISEQDKTAADVDLSGALHHLRQLNHDKSNNITDINAISDDMSTLAVSDDELLFQDPPPKEECQICFLPMPHSSGLCGVDKTYQSCCGKTVCSGCDYTTDGEMKRGNLKDCCPYCRLPMPNTFKEYIKRCKKRMVAGDAEAFNLLASTYNHGWGVKTDYNKAAALIIQAAERGSIRAHYNLGMSYEEGLFTEKNMGKAIHHYKTAAIGGHEEARYNLGIIEAQNGNMEKARAHFLISARSGVGDALKKVGQGYKAGHVTKDEYASALRAHQLSLDEMKSEQRTKAAAARKRKQQKL